jgi:hypothetical protein
MTMLKKYIGDQLIALNQGLDLQPTWFRRGLQIVFMVELFTFFLMALMYECPKIAAILITIISFSLVQRLMWLNSKYGKHYCR